MHNEVIFSEDFHTSTPRPRRAIPNSENRPSKDSQFDETSHTSLSYHNGLYLNIMAQQLRAAFQICILVWL